METQRRWREFMPGFTFHLGFVGERFKHGNAKEQVGDEAFISKSLFLQPQSGRGAAVCLNFLA